MALQFRLPASGQRQYFQSILDFRGGTLTLLNQARTEKKFAVESTNIYQVQDGIWKTRPGTKHYGKEITGATNIDGAFEYETTAGVRELIAIADDGYVYKSIDAGNWTKISESITFTPRLKYFYKQIGSKLLIANGTDDLTYYDGTDLFRYSAISMPTNVALARNVLTSGAYDNYYRIAAVNEIGYTEPQEALKTISTNKHRESWSTTSNERIDITWDAVTGADGYQVFWGEFDGKEYLIAETSSNSFQDLGAITYPPNIYIETPDDNTTTAPKFTSMEISGNRLWATGDANNPFRVYHTGTGYYFSNPAFSPFYGGNYIDLERGGKIKPVSVVHYRTGGGTPVITVLCSSADGQGTIFQIELNTITLGAGTDAVTATVPAAYKIVGSIGTDSAYSVVKVGDEVYFANKKGIYSLQNKQQMFNILSTPDKTSNIRNKWEALNQSKMEDVTGYYRPPRMYYSVAEGSENDRTIIYDTERRNWTWAWTIGYRQFLEYTDNTVGKVTRFLAIPITGNQLVEINEQYTGDLGATFYQSYISPIIRIADDYTLQAKVRDVIFELGNFRGTVNLEVLGITKNKQVSVLRQKTITSTTGTSGVGDDLLSDMQLSDTQDYPTTYAESTTKKRLKVNKRLYALQFKITANNADTVFELLGLQAKGTVIPSRPPSNWN